MNKSMVIPGNNDYRLDSKLDRLVPVDLTSGDAPIECVDGKFTLALYEVMTTVTKEWLTLFCEYRVFVPSAVKHAVKRIKFTPYNLSSHGVKRKHLIVFDEPVTLPKNNAYRVIPLYPHLAITKKGDIIDAMVGKFYPATLKQTIKHYPCRVVWDPYLQKEITVRLHRLVALAWVDNDDWAGKPITDHINGDKGDFHADNLRWVSFAENARLKAEQGLASDNITVKVHDYDTGKTTIFPSMTQACEYMGRSRINHLGEFLETPRLVKGRYQIKLIDDTSAWDFNREDTLYSVSIDGVEKHYARLKDVIAGYKLGVPEKKGAETVRTALLKKYPQAKISFPSARATRAVTYQVMHRETGKVETYNDRRSISEATGLSKSSVAKAIRLGADRAINGYSIREARDEAWPEVTDLGGYKNHRVTLRDVKGETVRELPSIRAVARELLVDKNSVLTALKTQRPIKGVYLSKAA